jgi:NAD(P)-dependent dehydrogenase (short-subunit alcohol dehydrogenase family)
VAITSRKTALVTGAGVRLGRATALALADAGMNVLVHYRRSEGEAAEVCRLVEQRGVRAWPIAADFDEPQSSLRLIDRAVATAGSLDVLVNNAAVFPKDDLHSMTFDHLMAAIRVNAWAPFELGRAFAERVGRGQIVNLLDSRIVDVDWAHVSYILSKQVLSAMTRMMALDFAPDISVNAVAPGLILPPPGQPLEYLEKRTGTVPLKRHGMPELIARAVVFLSQSEFITGQVIFVDGGRHLEEYKQQHG